MKRARPGRIVLVAFLTELVLIAAGNNQWVNKYVFDHVVGTQNSFPLKLADAAMTYSWRVSKQGRDAAHNWLGQLVLIGTVLVVTALLVFALARGVVSFGRVFFGTWTAVIVATEVATIVRGLVLDDHLYGFTNRASFAFFGQAGPSGYNFLGGVGLGLLVGLAAAITAVATRRTAGVVIAPSAPAAAPAEGVPPRPQIGAPPWFGQRQPTPAPITEPARDEHANLIKGGPPPGGDAVTEQPSVESAGQESPGQQSPGQESAGPESAGPESAGQQSPGQQSPGQQSPGQQSAGQQSPGQQSPGQESPGQESTSALPPVGPNDPRASALQEPATQRTSQFPPVADEGAQR